VKLRAPTRRFLPSGLILLLCLCPSLNSQEPAVAPLRSQNPLDPLDAQTTQAPDRTTPEKLLAEGQQLVLQGTAASLRRALDKFIEGASRWHDIGDRRMEAITLSHIGKVYDALSEKEKALDYYNRALPMLEAVGDRNGVVATLNNIGLIHDELGEKQKALDYYSRALSSLNGATSAENAGRASLSAVVLVNIGLASDSLGEKQKALEFYSQALDVLRALGDNPREAVTLNNIGFLYDSLGEKKKALFYFNQALAVLRSLGDERVAAVTLNNIGYLYDSLGEKQKALGYFNEALPKLRLAGDRRTEAVTLNNIGLVLRSLGDSRKALEYFDQALLLRRAVGDRAGEAITLSDKGYALALLGQRETALDHYRKSLAISRAVEDGSNTGLTLYRLAQLERDRGQLFEARAQIEAALLIVESLRGNLVSRELRASYFASVLQYFETYIDILLRLHKRQPSAGHDVAAFEASERARARTLVESLAEAGADIRQGVDGNLLERERSLRLLLNARASAQTRLLNSNHHIEQAARLRSEVEELLIEYQQAQAQIRINSPRYAALTQPLPSSLKQIQREVLDPGTLLLEYSLGTDRSYLWAVTSDAIESFELPPRDEIEKSVRHIYGLLTARNRHIRFETPEEKRARVSSADEEYRRAAAALSDILLAPVAGKLKDQRLLIVSDGALHYLPFAVLPSPAAVSGPLSVRGRRTTDRAPRAMDPLFVNHEIVNLPSASTLQVLRRELEGRQPAPKTLAVLADPVFEKSDERVVANGTTGAKPPDRRGAELAEHGDLGTFAAQTSAQQPPAFTSDQFANGDAVEARIQRLPFTRREANEIARLAPERDRMEALDFDASRATVISAQLSQYRYVHFATHGLLNSEHPELSGLVLSLIDRNGSEQNGFLRAYEIFNLHLPAELVVLSGCRTGLGTEIKGEGLVGMTRAFMYAGARRVLVSLWDISDEASAELMKHLYEKMLGKEKLSPAAALRDAQITISQDKRWQAPYYWAAFVLQGEPQ
jgi:CHAT domain-containing protein/Tfp pilus assembly protein PilF